MGGPSQGQLWESRMDTVAHRHGSAARTLFAEFMRLRTRSRQINRSSGISRCVTMTRFSERASHHGPDSIHLVPLIDRNPRVCTEHLQGQRIRLRAGYAADLLFAEDASHLVLPSCARKNKRGRNASSPRYVPM